MRLSVMRSIVTPRATGRHRRRSTELEAMLGAHSHRATSDGRGALAGRLDRGPVEAPVASDFFRPRLGIAPIRTMRSKISLRETVLARLTHG